MMTAAIRMLKLLASPLLQNTQTPGPGQDTEMLVRSCAFRPAQDGTLVNASKKILLTPVETVNRTGCPISRVLCEKWGFCSSPIAEADRPTSSPLPADPPPHRWPAWPLCRLLPR